MPNGIHERVTWYLSEACSIEAQGLAQLRMAQGIAIDADLSSIYAEHRIETEVHERIVRDALEARGAKPSEARDAPMLFGGTGFSLFARLQPDTAARLHAHALSYEALEFSFYQLVRRVAERADESEVIELAKRIAANEAQMIERLEARFARVADASLHEASGGDLRQQLCTYLADAHAIEEQAIALLERAPKLAGSERLAIIYEDHLAETREHAEMIAQRLQALGGESSSLQDAALRLGALNWAAFFPGQPDTPGKLACFARAFEHLEIGGYEQLRRFADGAGDEQTARASEWILAQEREASERIAAAFDDAVSASLEAQEVLW